MELYRMHLKTDVKSNEKRQELIKYCIQNQCLAIGWSFLHKNHDIRSMDCLDRVAKEHYVRIPAAISTFRKINIDDLIWTRDLDGNGYLCRVKAEAKPYEDQQLDIGCILKVDLVKIGTNIPGRVVSSFAFSRTIQRICDEKIILYSQLLYNLKTGSNYYNIEQTDLDLFGLLHPLDVEELVCCYVQFKYDAILSKNSIAKQDTTIKIEGEFYPRVPTPDYQSIVLQVKTGGSYVPVQQYKSYTDQNKLVVLFFECENYDIKIPGIDYLTKKELLEFAYKTQECLPPVIQAAVEICKTGLQK